MRNRRDPLFRIVPISKHISEPRTWFHGGKVSTILYPTSLSQGAKYYHHYVVTSGTVEACLLNFASQQIQRHTCASNNKTLEGTCLLQSPCSTQFITVMSNHFSVPPSSNVFQQIEYFATKNSFRHKSLNKSKFSPAKISPVRT